MITFITILRYINITLILSVFFLTGCGTVFYKPQPFKKTHLIMPVQNQKKVCRVYNGTAFMDCDSISISIQKADFEFIKNNFPQIGLVKKIFRKQQFTLVPFFIAEKSKIKGLKKGLIYSDPFSVFYIKIKNNKKNKIFLKPSENSVIVDDMNTQFLAMTYNDIKSAKLNNMYRKRKTSAYFSKVARPLFKYSGINVVTNIATNFGSNLDFIDLRIHEVNKMFDNIQNFQLYEYKFEFPKNLVVDGGYIYPTVEFSGFLVFPHIKSSTKKFKLIIPKIITDFNKNGSPKNMKSFEFDFIQDKLNQKNKNTQLLENE